MSRPSDISGLLQIEFSVNIACGSDHALLIYGLNNGAWTEQMRWQAPPLKKISDAFGDFFLSGTLAALEGDASKPRIVVAHGRPWCTSRFSGFAIDVLSPGSGPDSPKVLWHTGRDYSRSDFIPKFKSSGDTFELRVNEASMDIDAFERSVIYRYQIDQHQSVRRIQPIAIHTRGFVEEWLSAPWEEYRAFSTEETGSDLKTVHDQFARPRQSEDEFVRHSYGPVRPCRALRTFQVEINSTLLKTVLGKPGGESRPLPTHYFHVREIKDGYLMVSAPTEPDPTCKGANLMAPK